MLVELSQKDSEWRRIALKICGNKQLADDIVQEMYIKLSTSTHKKLNTSYVSACLYHLYINEVRGSKKITELNPNIYKETFEGLDDRQKNIIDSLPWYQKQIMLHHQNLSIRQIESKFNINRGFVYDTIKKVKSKVKNG